MDTPATGGTAIAADGVIYLSDVNRRQILTITGPAGRYRDRRPTADLVERHVDRRWGYLWIPATQLNRALAGERQAVNYPV